MKVEISGKELRSLYEKARQHQDPQVREAISTESSGDHWRGFLHGWVQWWRIDYNLDPKYAPRNGGDPVEAITVEKQELTIIPDIDQVQFDILKKLR